MIGLTRHLLRYVWAYLLLVLGVFWVATISFLIFICEVAA